jgi:photosystem II stability/assembly factor-like uncharacterized protein
MTRPMLSFSREHRGLSRALSGVIAGLGALSALLVAGCASTDDSFTIVDRKELRTEGRMPAVKPAGLALPQHERQRLGPPPYGYIKIIGEPMPNWDQARAKQVADGPDSGLNWSFLGPKPIASEYWSGNENAGGHIAAIAPHPTDPNICYIASDTGGVWKTTNGGGIWTPKTDTLPTMNHGALALDPLNPDIIYAGTGSLNTGNTGDGLFRSTDGGENWTKIAPASLVGSQISHIAIHPTNPQIIHVSGSGGYVRSTNGGTTWTIQLAGVSNSVILNPTNPNIVYVGRSGQGVYRSIDGGNTVTKLTNGIPGSGISAVYVEIAKSNPDVVYACMLNTNGSLNGVYRTADGGNSWVKKANTPNFPAYGNYCCFLAVSPTNPDHVFVGGVDPRYEVAGVLRTLDGGNTWTDISNGPPWLHPDHHCMAFGPAASSGQTVWQGNDGGIYKSINNGDTWINLNSTLAAAQIYNVVQHPTLPNKLMAGTQDNGTPEQSVAGTSWPQLQIGDGGFSVFDPTTTTNRRYTTYVYLATTRWVNGSSVGISGPWNGDPANFIAPLVGDPSNGKVLLGGTNRIWRTLDATTATVSWTAISTSTVSAGGTINAIAVAPPPAGNSNYIYSGSSTGKVYVTTDASNWQNRSTGLPNGQISDIVVSPADPAIAFVSFYNTSGNRVLKTTNAGVTWSSVTGNLPSGVRANALAVDWELINPTLFVGSGAGAYFSTDGGATWTKNGAELPNVNVADLYIDPVKRTITAGTYGRGAWRANLPTVDVCTQDCDSSGTLDINDFICFQTLFAISDPKADCDANGLFNIDDFICFQTLFALGC